MQLWGKVEFWTRAILMFCYEVSIEWLKLSTTMIMLLLIPLALLMLSDIFFSDLALISYLKDAFFIWMDDHLLFCFFVVLSISYVTYLQVLDLRRRREELGSYEFQRQNSRIFNFWVKEDDKKGGGDSPTKKAAEPGEAVSSLYDRLISRKLTPSYSESARKRDRDLMQKTLEYQNAYNENILKRRQSTVRPSPAEMIKQRTMAYQRPSEPRREQSYRYSYLSPEKKSLKNIEEFYEDDGLLD